MDQATNTNCGCSSESGRNGKTSCGGNSRAKQFYKPSVDIFEQGEALVLLADVPGATADGINVELEKGTLTITADVSARNLGNDARPIHLEYGVGGYRRSFEVGESINVNGITAELANGVLKLTLPKNEKAQPKKIPVKVM